MSTTDQPNLGMLIIFKDEALERIADDDRVIAAQRERIAELERVLKRTRAHIYDIYSSTVGVLSNEFTEEPKAAKASKPKRKPAA